jgi:hypothetical protein
VPRPAGPARGVRGCGRNNIDARAAEEAVHAPMVARLSDPRRAERVAAYLAQVRAERSRIAGEIARWEATADELVTRTASGGVARVDAAMAPILAQVEQLRQQLAQLDENPASDHAATADAVAAWEEAVARGDIPTQRAMINRASHG